MIFQLCGGAISQIIRKASGSKREVCLSILFEATEKADNSNVLIELTGNVELVAVSIKTTGNPL